MSLDRNRLRKSTGKLRRLLKKQDWRNPETIHDFRTQARRFEACVEALRLHRRGNERRLLCDLAQLRKRAGKIRDMDVFTACALTAQAAHEQDCVVQLLEHLGAKRYRRASKMEQHVSKNGRVLRRRLKRSSVHVDSLRGPNNGSDTAKQLATDAMANALKLSSQLKTPARLTRATLHSYRLKVKELRYVLQMSKAADEQKFIDKLGEVKDAIGEWHDWEELSSIATELLSHGRECKLLRELKAVSKGKFGRALSLANEMRNTYLPWKANAGPSKAKPARRLARPVLVAASAIAE